MTLEDMTDLVNAHDGVNLVNEAAAILGYKDTTITERDSALSRLYSIYYIIERNSKFRVPEGEIDYVRDEQGRTLDDILELDLPAEERAKLLMCDDSVS